jgi:hypothetical protein
VKHSLFFFYFFCHGFVSLSRVNKVALCVAFIAAVVVPATVLSIVVMSEQERVASCMRIITLFHACYSVEFFSYGSSNDCVMFVLMNGILHIEM